MRIFQNLEMITVTDSQMTADITETPHHYEKILIVSLHHEKKKIYTSLKAPQDALNILRKIYFWNTHVAQSFTNFTCCMLDMISFT